MQKWDYLVKEVDQAHVMIMCEDIGAEGWELVSAYVLSRAANADVRVSLIFKKPEE